MKTLLYFLGTFIATIAVAFGAYQWLQSFGSAGYVLMGIDDLTIETTLANFAVLLIISFFLCYCGFRFAGYLIRLPKQMKTRGEKVKFDRSQEALIAGLVDSAEGNWERAESILIKHASHSGAPLLHYLTAARAAHSRHAFDKRDEYLQKAVEQAPDASIAVGLTQAELHLSGNQFKQALTTLTQLHSINPSHASVLKLLHQTYQHLGDWEALRRLLPSLNSNKVLIEAEIKLLEIETFTQVLKNTIATANVEAVKQLWTEIPAHVKKLKSIAAIYFAAIIDLNGGAEIEDALATTLATTWNKTLLVLFGSIQSSNPQRQLEMAEQWLTYHPSDAVLLAVLGKLSIHCGENSKAQDYLDRSIVLDPSVQAYQLLADLLFMQGDKDRASACYKAGLELASNELVGQVNTYYE
ncbi:MAG: heme biosynthesis HemY N-terminal domain-containing protein [Methylococcaceae bacterium]